VNRSRFNAIIRMRFHRSLAKYAVYVANPNRFSALARLSYWLNFFTLTSFARTEDHAAEVALCPVLGIWLSIRSATVAITNSVYFGTGSQVGVARI
jgi:hypothetical protein